MAAREIAERRKKLREFQKRWSGLGALAPTEEIKFRDQARKLGFKDINKLLEMKRSRPFEFTEKITRAIKELEKKEKKLKELEVKPWEIEELGEWITKKPVVKKLTPEALDVIGDEATKALKDIEKSEKMEGKFVDKKTKRPTKFASKLWNAIVKERIATSFKSVKEQVKARKKVFEELEKLRKAKK